MDRRKPRQKGQSPKAVLTQLPALVVLDRLPVPTLAVENDGTILFANAAFAAMLGYCQDAVASVGFDDIIDEASANGSAVKLIKAYARTIVELKHADGFGVRALMSGSALLRQDDSAALVTFQDLTELEWSTGHG